MGWFLDSTMNDDLPIIIIINGKNVIYELNSKQNGCYSVITHAYNTLIYKRKIEFNLSKK